MSASPESLLLILRDWSVCCWPDLLPSLEFDVQPVIPSCSGGKVLCFSPPGGLFEDVAVEAEAFWSTRRQLPSTEHSQGQEAALWAQCQDEQEPELQNEDFVQKFPVYLFAFIRWELTVDPCKPKAMRKVVVAGCRQVKYRSCTSTSHREEYSSLCCVSTTWKHIS